MRTITEDFREYAFLDRKRTGEGVTPNEYERWQALRDRLDGVFSSRPPGKGERRGSLRVPTRLAVSYDSLAGLEGTVTNLSRSGCFIRTGLPAAVGTRLTLLLRVGDEPSPVELEAEVVSRESGAEPCQRGMGLRFASPSPEQRKKLDDLYESLPAGESVEAHP